MERVIFNVKGEESALVEALIDQNKKTVLVSYLEQGKPKILGFPREKVENKFGSGDWVILSRTDLAG